ncbi:uncharacterized protein LOC110974224 [Acanthaster planci]|uniref:Uncharacterized protein LOC110974224 n=1 Tax=Acanthaster planci TaxID=133434 RepID=A0A8B7XKS5_ACAPL|nr:uncharacterized protein LOC110974224 [Acanthaster planci]
MAFKTKYKEKRRMISGTMLHYRKSSDQDVTESAISDRNPALFPRDYLKPLLPQDFPLAVRRSQVLWDAQNELLQRATEATRRMEVAKAKFYAWPDTDGDRKRTAGPCQLLRNYRNWEKVTDEGALFSQRETTHYRTRRVHFNKEIKIIRI